MVNPASRTTWPKAQASERDGLFRDLLNLEIDIRRQRGEIPLADEYQARFPEHRDVIARVLQPSVSRERLGDYELIEELGRGGMGIVYKARQVFLDQIVALKVLPERYLGDSQVVSRFQREMKLIGQLEHPNIVRAYYAGEDRGIRFLVMEFVKGVTLEQLVTQRGPVSVGAACELVRQTARGLQEAHEHDLVHRDIKPANLMLSTSGVLKILDLGLARLRSGKVTQLTAAGGVMGTPDYMAPEQWDDSTGVNIRADIYSLGCTLFYLVTGEPPYGGESCDTLGKKLKAHANAPIPSASARRPGCPKMLDSILRRMLAKKPDDRFASPAALAEAVGACADAAELATLVPPKKIADGSGTSFTPPVSNPETETYRRAQEQVAKKPCRKRPTGQLWKRLVLGVLAAAVVCGVALGLVVWFSPESFWKPPPQQGGVGNPAVAKEESSSSPTVKSAGILDEIPWTCERLCTSPECLADSELYGRAALDPNPIELANVCNLYQKAYETTQQPDAQAVIAYKQAITLALAGVAAEDIRRGIESPAAASRRAIALKVVGLSSSDAPRKSLLGKLAARSAAEAESQRLQLVRLAAAEILAFKEKGPIAGREAFAGFVREFVHGESPASNEQRRDAIGLKLLCAGLLVRTDLHESAIAANTTNDLECLDSVLAAFPHRSRSLPFLRPYYDLAIQAVGESDPDRAAGFILSSRDESRSKDAVMVLFHLGARNGIAVVVPPQGARSGKSILFRLDFGREQVKQRPVDSPIRLDRRLIQLVNAKRVAGRRVEIRWSDAKCWSDPAHALTEADYAPLARQIPL